MKSRIFKNIDCPDTTYPEIPLTLGLATKVNIASYFRCFDDQGDPYLVLGRSWEYSMVFWFILWPFGSLTLSMASSNNLDQILLWHQTTQKHAKTSRILWCRVQIGHTCHTSQYWRSIWRIRWKHGIYKSKQRCSVAHPKALRHNRDAQIGSWKDEQPHWGVRNTIFPETKKRPPESCHPEKPFSADGGGSQLYGSLAGTPEGHCGHTAPGRH